MPKPAKIVPTILSGGSGTRLWPLSRTNYPKQFHVLSGTETMLVQTMRRVSSPSIFSAPIIIGSTQHRFIISEQLYRAGYENARVVLEPCSRNTAAAAAVAALLALEQADGEETLILLLPADHVILDQVGFQEAVVLASRAAGLGYLTLFGITPNRPATGYGYICRGEEIGSCPGSYVVDRFVEKPNAHTAEKLIKDQNYSWNSGIFLLPAKKIIEEMRVFAPKILDAATKAVEGAIRDSDYIRLEEAAFAAAPSISLDYAVMERTRHAAVVPASLGWTDVGNWSTLWEIAQKDVSGNVILGDVLEHDAVNCYLRSEGLMLGVAGIHDLIVIAMRDAVLVVDRNSDQDVKILVERLQASGRNRLIQGDHSGQE